MAIVLNGAIEKGIEIRGRIGRPNFLGCHMLGLSQLGDSDERAGFYQRRPRKGGQIIVKMKHYFPSPGYTPTQIANRSVFADGVAMWHTLTDLQKEGYNRAKYPTGLSGFCRFMREYLNANL